jgi:hypothetical protein
VREMGELEGGERLSARELWRLMGMGMGMVVEKVGMLILEKDGDGKLAEGMLSEGKAVRQVSGELEPMMEIIPVGMEKLGGENDGIEMLPMLILGTEVDGGDKTGVWKDALPMLILGTVIEAGARLVLGMVMDGGARLIELKDGGCDGMTSELNEGGARLIELSEGG